MAAISQSTALRVTESPSFYSKNVVQSTRNVKLARKFVSHVARCSAENERADKRSLGSQIFLPLLGTSLAAGIALTTVLPQHALAEAGFRLTEPQAIALIADADVEEGIAAPATPNDPFERAKKLRALLDQKKQEAEERAAAAKAESEAIAKANAENKLALEEAKKAELKSAPTPAPAPPPSPAPVPQEQKVAPVAVSSSPAPVAPSAPKKKSHGGIPLFLAQFLVLAAYGGAGYALVKVPDSFWESISSTAESTASVVLPKVDEAVKKYSPVVEKGVETAKKLAIDAQPYVSKAVEAAKPLALEAFEKAKPILKQGQEKASALVSDAQEKLKAKLNEGN